MGMNRSQELAISRGVMAGVLALVMAASTWTIHIYSVLAPFIIEELSISRIQLGLLMTLASLAGAVLSPSAGRFADHFGGKATLQAALLVSIVTTLLVAVAPTYSVLLLASLLAGSMSAAGNPGTNKLITSALPLGSRGVVMGVKQSGVQAGIFFVGIVLPSLAIAAGWRVAVGCLALVSCGTLILTSLILPGAEVRSGQEVSDVVPYAHTSGVRQIAAYAFFMGIGGAGLTSFLPLYAHEELGLSVRVAGGAAAVIGLIGIASRIIWSHRTELAGRYWLPLRVMAASAVVAVLLVWSSSWLGVPLLWPGVALAGLAVVAWNGVALLAAVAEAGHEGSGRASGLVLMGFFAGLSISPVTMGFLVDSTGSYDVAWFFVLLSFVAAVASASNSTAMTESVPTE